MSAHFQSAHFGSSHNLSSHFGRGVIIVPPPDFTPEPVHPPGMRDRLTRAQIMEEDEAILAIIMAFLEMKK